MEFTIEGKSFPVHVLSGKESLHEPFCFTLDILLYFHQWTSSWLLSSATLSLPFRTISGVVTSEIQEAFDETLLRVKITFEPQFSLLKNQQDAKLFLNKSITDIVKTMAPSVGFTEDKPYPQKPLIFQPPEESDAAFLKRICANDGLFFQFDGRKNFGPNSLSGFKLTSTSFNHMEGESAESRFKTGDIIDNKYLITEIVHTAAQPSETYGAGQTVTYHNKISCIPANQAFRWEPVPFPLLPLNITAHIESTHTYAQLDEKGHYTNRLRLDASDNQYTEAMPTLRRLSPYGGLHFPIHNHAEILIGFLWGNPDHPVMLGSLHNGEKKSPVSDKNPKSHILRTEKSNEFLAEDTEEHHHLHLQNSESQNQLRLDHSVSMTSQQGNINLVANNNITHNSASDTFEETESHYLRVIKRDFSSTTKTSDLSHTSHKNHMITTKKSSFLSSTENINIQSGNQFTHLIGDNLTLNTRDTTLTLKSTAGNINLLSGNDLHIIGLGDGNLQLLQGGTSIEITKDGTVNFNASQINLSGQPVFSMQPTPPGGGASITAKNIADEKIKKHKKIDHNYNIFVATVYNEAAWSSYIEYGKKTYYRQDALEKRIPKAAISSGQQKYKLSSEAAWKAVGSVIMNRSTSSGKTPEEIVSAHSQFDAYGTINWHKTLALLDEGHQNENGSLEKMYEELKPIYYQHQVTTNANSYYSPVAQAKSNRKPPNWSTDKTCNISGLKPIDDFIFYLDKSRERR